MLVTGETRDDWNDKANFWLKLISNGEKDFCTYVWEGQINGQPICITQKHLGTILSFFEFTVLPEKCLAARQDIINAIDKKLHDWYD